MQEILLIRHGMTAGNLKRQYIGSTDQPLCPEGVEALRLLHYPRRDKVFVTGLQRTAQTAKILFSQARQVVVPGLEEMNFGIFEGKTYEELKELPEYRRWLDSGGEASIPGGESKREFCARCVSAFRERMAVEREERLTFVVHGGTIMALMEALGLPKRSYYDWQIKNGCSLTLQWDGAALIYKKTGDLGSL